MVKNSEIDSSKGAKKIALTLYDSEGRKIELQIDEETSPEYISKLIQSLGFSPTPQTNTETEVSPSSGFSSKITSTYKHDEIPDVNSLSKIDLVKLLFRSISQYDNQWFSAKEIMHLYKTYIDPEIPQSTISTYLARLHKDGLLKRRGSRRDLEYCMVIEEKVKIPLFRFSREADQTIVRRVEE
ncbi:MAG: hypothetical protein ACXAC7_07200 [Candidatus Hodarchaeales archaeon]|jgi:hypothetical protein